MPLCTKATELGDDGIILSILCLAFDNLVNKSLKQMTILNILKKRLKPCMWKYVAHITNQFSHPSSLKNKTKQKPIFSLKKKMGVGWGVLLNDCCAHPNIRRKTKKLPYLTTQKENNDN